MEIIELEKRKKKVYEFILSDGYVPMKIKEMAIFFNVPKVERGEFHEVIEGLISDGKIIVSPKGKINLPDETVKSGVFMGTKRGFGFVRVEGEDEDIFVPENGCKDAFDGDVVTVQIWKSHAPGKKGANRTSRRREGEILRILERKTDRVIGTFTKNQNFGFVIADNEKFGKDIFVSKYKDKSAVDGHKVVVKLTSYGENGKNPEGEIIEILGHRDDPGVDILSVIRSFGLPEEFPEEVIKQILKIPYEVSTEEIGGRVDLRNQMTVTIDGEDAKDLDDAITLTKTEDGLYHLGVHIADVSHYVTEQSPLDKEAVARGTSIYLVDRVIPMLPHQLSNGICSLNAGVDRLSLSCMMDIDEKGQIISHRIAETVICVDERMNYSDVSRILVEKDEILLERYEKQVEMFKLMEQLAAILRKDRKRQGSIDFDFPECKIKLDGKGKPIDIVPYDRNVATRLIEEFMLAANRTVAEDYFWLEAPFLYRTHEYPDLDRIKELASLTKNFGYTLKVGTEEVHPRELQKLIEQIEGTDEEAFLSRITLRSMKRAKYSTVCEGHFGLAMHYYSHFTSPIRRYPDLQIHRIIKENIRKGLSGKRTEHYHKILPNIALQASTLERRADDAEREVSKIKKAEYMLAHLSEEFEGVISGVTSWGMFVELPNTVEGMVRIADIQSDHFEYNEEKYCITGKKTGVTYRLGEKIRVLVAKVDKLTHTIDFEIVTQEED